VTACYFLHPEDEMLEISSALARALVKEQFPQWAELPIYPVEESGHDHRTFHLGDRMSIRLPSEEAYVPQVDKEDRWLPYLSDKLQVPIPIPIAKGRPGSGYLWPWSVRSWVDGNTASRERVKDLEKFAIDLAAFLTCLQSIDPSDGPAPGEHNFYRGGSLAVYDDESRAAIERFRDELDASLCLAIWERALSTAWGAEPLWIHGDMDQGNLLVDQSGRLSGVIDFGLLGIGDPACDLVLAWTFFDRKSRISFKEAVNLDENTWDRARGWALWKALISYHADPGSSWDQVSKEKATLAAIFEEFLSPE
jgi:aminoglycoside phosphotransferase (APT) family kinase protein